MKLFIKLMVLVLIAALAAPFFIKGPDGRPLMEASDFRGSLADARRSVERQWRSITSRFGRGSGGNTATVYRWRDADGNWVYSDQPNPAGNSEQVTVRTDVNVMDLPDAPPPAAPAAAPGAAPARPDESSPMVPLILQPERVDQLFEDVKKIESDAAQRAEELERAR